MSEIVRVTNLSKKFKEVQAVDDLSFSVPKGEVYGFLGQNGAGKSTTIRILLTLIKQDKGDINIFGLDLAKSRNLILRKIGAIIEKPDFYKYLTAFENISLMAKLSGVKLTKPELMQHLERTGIAERAHSKVKTFSQGMRQRLGIACALVNSPELIVLDEPTNGLDPQGIADIRNLILHLSKEEGKTILVSSHLLSEIEVIADSMLIIDRGKKVVEGKVSILLDPADTLVALNTTNDTSAISILANSQWREKVQSKEPILLKMHRADVPALTKFLVERDVNIVSISPRHSLEDFFLSLTNSNQHVATYQA